MNLIIKYIFEIKKIESVNPQIGEDEELLSLKKLIAKKEKTY
jgi:DNA repair ATPase RecN